MKIDEDLDFSENCRFTYNISKKKVKAVKFQKES